MILRGARSRAGAAVAAGVAVFVALLSGCAPEPVPAPTTSVATPTPAPTPAPSPTLAAAVVPFGGDCSRAAGTDEIGAVLASTDLEPYPGGLSALEPDLDASLALVGGLHCSWSGTTTEGGIAFAAIALFPLDTLPRAIVDGYADLQCDQEGLCGRARVVEGTWILANVFRDQGRDQPIGPAERERVDRRVDGLLSAVAAADAGELVSSPAERSSDWWALPGCDDLSDAVPTAAGLDDADSGFPGDSTPSGTVWDVANATGVDRWCSWYAFDGAGQVRIVQLYVQPGIGAPADDALSAADAEPADVLGATAAWTVSGDADHLRLVAASGWNRVTVDVSGLSVSAAQDAAAAAIAALDR